MKVLFLTNKVPWPLKDGGAIGTFNLAYGLYLAGCNIKMLSINTSKHTVDESDIPREIQNSLNINTININTDIRFFPLIKNLVFSKKPYIAERFNSPLFSEKLIDCLKSESFDIIILEILYMGTYIPLIRQYSDAHISLHAPNIEHEIWERIAKNENNPLKKAYLKQLANRIRKYEFNLMNNYDSLIPVAETNAKTYKQMGVTVPVFVAKIGVFFDKIDKCLSNNNIKEELAFAHIGALDWIPNLEGLKWFLNEVWPGIHQKRPDIKFYVAGRNAPAKIKETLNQPGVVYLGEVPDAYEFICSKSIMIVPLLSGSGMRVKIIESLALEKAIVSTSVGAEGIEVENNIHIRIEDQPKAFARACLELCDNKELRETIGKNGNIMVRNNYDNVKIGKNLKSFYQKIIQ